MKLLVTLACLLMLATPAAAQELYWMISLNDGDEMQMSAFGLTADIGPGDFYAGEIPSAGGEVYLLIEASTGWFLDAPPEQGDEAPAVAVASESADMGGAASEEGSEAKHRSFPVAAIWAMNADTETTVHWNLTGVDAHGRDGPEGHYLVRITYAATAPLE